MTEAIFEIRSQVGTSLSSRNAVDSLFNRISESGCIFKAILDFKGVDFISRASADQLVKSQNDIFQNRNIVIELRNLNEDSFKMIQIAAGTQNKAGRNKTLLPVYNITSFHSLEKFLMGI